MQHFWSLAVEEQFYIVWPLLIVLLTFLIRRGHVASRPGLALGLAAITIPSLAWSIHLTSANPRTAHFVTTTRLWELGNRRPRGGLGGGMAASTCTFADDMVDIDGRPYTACRAWGEEILGRLTGSERPDAVITSSLRSDALVDGRLDKAALSAGYVRWWRALGVPVIALADNPQPGGEIYAGVADHPTSYMSDCSRPAGPGSGTRALAAAVEGWTPPAWSTSTT